MSRKSFWLWIFLLVLCGVGTQVSVQADGPLPPAGWYIVVWDSGDNKLHWINAEGGEQVLNAVPLMPNQRSAAGVPRLRISPNGRYAVIAGGLQNGLEALGIFDFATGAFVSVFEAQPDETILVGEPLSFSTNSSQVSVGFTAADQSWRVITFSLVTGDILFTLNSTDAAVTGLKIDAAAVYPSVFYVEEDNAAVHIQLFAVDGPQDGNAQSALRWSPNDGDVEITDYTSVQMDILPLYGDMVYPLVGDDNTTSLILQHIGDDESKVLLTDDMVRLSQPHWVQGSNWIVYQATDANGAQSWQYIDPYGASPRTLPGDYEIIGGLYDSFYAIKGNVLSVGSDLGSFATSAYTGRGTLTVLYATPMGATFELESVATRPVSAAPTAAPTLTNTPVGAAAVCSGAPASRVTVKMNATVIQSVRLRRFPEGDVIATLPIGTTLRIQEGPRCQGGYLWWLVHPRDAVAGWIAEGTQGNYFIEPLETATPTDIPATIAPTLTPTAASPASGDCSSAPEQTIAVGDTVITRGSGTLAMRDTVSAQVPSAQIPSGETGTVTDGPVCFKGLRMWKVTFSSGAQGWVADGFEGRVYLRKE